MTSRSVAASPVSSPALNRVVSVAPQRDTLADVLERVLDKGVVIVGDIVVSVLDIELLTLKLRLLISSADTARRMGVDWWSGDAFFSKDGAQDDSRELEQLRARVAELESRLDDQRAPAETPKEVPS